MVLTRCHTGSKKAITALPLSSHIPSHLSYHPTPPNRLHKIFLQQLFPNMFQTFNHWTPTMSMTSWDIFRVCPWGGHNAPLISTMGTTAHLLQAVADQSNPKPPGQPPQPQPSDENASKGGSSSIRGHHHPRHGPTRLSKIPRPSQNDTRLLDLLMGLEGRQKTYIQIWVQTSHSSIHIRLETPSQLFV